jgi:hypothetical protein
VVRDFLTALVRQLLPEPLVEVTGSHFVDVTVNRKDGRLCINLVNTAGPHADENTYVFDEVSPVGPLTIKLRLGHRPKSLTVRPAGKKLRFTYSKGVTQAVLPRLDIYDIVVAE